jgi:predicted RNA-binding Zn-ribbon protein involved in translation (DUF1610 family)
LPRSLPRAIIRAKANAHSLDIMSEISVNFVCPKCRHRYSSAAHSGPRAVCPECGYGPTMIDYAEDQPTRVLPYFIALLVAVAVVAATYAIVM